MMTTLAMREVSPAELKKMMEDHEDFQLIDIREEHELHYCTLNGSHIPMGEIINRVDEIRRDIPVVIHCRSGKRASAVIYTLEAKFHFTNLINLKGGILGYAAEVDPTMQSY